MDFPGLNVKGMTDDELLKKISELQGKLVAAHGLGSSVVEQLQWMVETLSFEQSERAAKRAWDYQQRRAPDVIETEPDLVKKKSDEDMPTKKKNKLGVSSSGSLLKRSRTPNAGGTTDI